MTDKRTITSKVEDLERKCNVKVKELPAVIFHFHMDGEPHGCMNSQRWIPDPKPPFLFKKEPLTYEEELAYGKSREDYAELVKQLPHLQDENNVWSTYEKWLEYYRCKCGMHGEDGKQPYYGDA